MQPWRADLPSLQQVLLAIQAQILADQPYVNEPSFERAMESEQGRRADEQEEGQGQQEAQEEGQQEGERQGE